MLFNKSIHLNILVMIMAYMRIFLFKIYISLIITQAYLNVRISQFYTNKILFSNIYYSA